MGLTKQSEHITSDLDRLICTSFEKMPTEPPHGHTVSFDAMQASADDPCDVCGVLRYKHEFTTTSPLGFWRWANKRAPVFDVDDNHIVNWSESNSWQPVSRLEPWVILKMLEWLLKSQHIELNRNNIRCTSNDSAMILRDRLDTRFEIEEQILSEAVAQAYAKAGGLL